MADPTTQKTGASAQDFLREVPDQKRRDDALEVDRLLQSASGEAGVMWGGSIVGYGEIPYTGARGKTATWPLISFSPRKTALVLYLNQSIEDDLLARLGPHRRGVGCLYLKRLSDVDRDVLRQIVDRSIELTRNTP